MSVVKIAVEFSGGAELLFGKVKRHSLELEESDAQGGKWTGETVRPGILVLINDADWELMGQLDYQLQTGDNVVFISTLHGG